MGKLKILIWTKWIDDIYLGKKPPDGIGGAEVQLAYWAKALAEFGCEVYTFGWRLSVAGKKLFGVNFLFVPWVRGMSFLLNGIRVIHFWKIKPDVVMVRSFRELGEVMKLTANTGTRVVYMFASDKNVEPKPDGINQHWQKILKEVDIILAQNEFQLSKAKETMGLENVTLQANVFNPAFFSISDSDERKIDFIWVGNLKAIKRPEWFLQLARSMPECSFVMLGAIQQGKYKDSAFQHELKKVRNLDYKGYVSLNESVKCMSESRFLVNTSEFEGMPNTFLQADALGCGILATVNPNKHLDERSNSAFVTSLDELLEKAVELERNYAPSERKVNQSALGAAQKLITKLSSDK